MTLTQAKKNLEKKEWYNQAGAVKPLYISYPWYTCSRMNAFGRKTPVKYDWLVFYKNNFMDNYLSQNSLIEVADYYFKRQAKEKNFIQKLLAYWHKNHIKSFKKFNEKILTLDFSVFSMKELIALIQSYNKVYLGVWHEAIFLDGFDFYGENILKDAMEKEKKDIAPRDLDLLLTPPQPSFLQQERLAILCLAEKFQRNKKTMPANFEKFCTKNQKEKKEFDDLSKKYYWLHNDFASSEYLGPKHFFEKVLPLTKDPKKLNAEKIMRQNLKTLARQKKAIAKKYKISADFLNTVAFLAILGNFRDERKTYNQMAGNSLHKFACEFALRTKTELNTIEHLFFWEWPEFLKARQKFSAMARKRMPGAFFFIHDTDKFSVFHGRDALELNSIIKDIISRAKDLRGRTAFPGKVKGIVKIIKDKSDFGKMQEGDILVAPNTRPEFVPIMKKASAIVTDEGGITSHAAIVSRELQIPCVVGVQCATMVLKDGDKVDVDASQGLITRL